MIRKYKNKIIYKNFKVAEILSLISIALSAISVIIFAAFKYSVNPYAEIAQNELFFYLFLIITPLNPLLYSVRAPKLVKSVKLRSETKLNNDFANTLCSAILIYIEIILLIFYLFIGIIFGAMSYAITWAYFCGYMFIPHILAYVAGIFLIINCVFIKREMKACPPTYYLQEQKEKLEKQREIAEIKQQKKLEQDTENYKKLIEQCGMKFFINYYPQIKHLPLRDITISENYSPSEKEERILAAKKLIDLNLTEFAITQILKEYGDFLSESEIAIANSILTELQKQA